MREETIQLIEVSKVGVEEFLRPKGSKSTGQKKCTDKNISAWTSEVCGQIAFEDGENGLVFIG